MPEPGYDVADALAAAARSMNSPHNLDDTLDAIVHAARVSVPGFDEVGISIVHPDGRVETRAATSQLVWDLDALQYELGAGPCLEAITNDPSVTVATVERLSEETRWPDYVPQATRAGVRAQMGLQLYVEEEILGGLNLYSTSQDTIDAEAVHVAELFATHAALALGRARREGRLTEALETRTLIGTATGLIMGRYQLTEQRAFQFLARASATSNIKLRDIAADIVWAADARHGPPAP